MPLPLYRGFLTPKKPSSMPRLDGEGRKRSISRQSQLSDQGPGKHVISPLAQERPIAEGRESVDGETALSKAVPSMGTGLSPVTGTFGHAPRQRDSVAEVSTQGGMQIAEQSSDDLVEDQHDMEKASNAHRMSNLRRKSTSRSRLRNTGTTPTKRYQTFDNPLTSWWLGGRVMIGGDRPWSVLFTLIILFGITGVWIGTSGVWYWRYGDQYGLAKGSGVAIVIIFA